MAWVVGLIVLAVALDQTDAVEAALVIVAASIVLGVCMAVLMRRGRIKEEEQT